MDCCDSNKAKSRSGILSLFKKLGHLLRDWANHRSWISTRLQSASLGYDDLVNKQPQKDSAKDKHS